ncbi:hypothetical protein AB0F72_08440 [Actinoplanes sp. NPDC023936]|uniref:hypothetical protein n=1 Tax=Actinoplanes sp. NPDC023936 TaxID=3154910 RepID=UPI0033F44E34
MDDLDPYTVEMPANDPIDDLWLVEFRHKGRQYRVTNITRRAAFWALRKVHNQEPGGMTSCAECHVERRPSCPHDGQLGWLWVDMSDCRMLPMHAA